MRVLAFVSGGLLLLLLVLPYCFPLRDHSSLLSSSPFPESRFATIEGTRVHYRLFTPARDSLRGRVLLLHGFSGSTFSWRNQFDTLVKSGYQVLAVDMPAFGYSDKRVSANLSDTLFTLALYRLMEEAEREKPQVSVQRWNVAGHSMGALTAGALATAFPEKTKALLLVDGAYLPQSGRRSFRTRMQACFLRMGFMQRWAEVGLDYYFLNEEKFTRLLASAYGEKPSSEAVKGYMQPFFQPRSAAAILEMASRRGYAQIDREKLSPIPKSLIWGTEDTWIPLSIAAGFVKENPEARLYRIEGAGHNPMETHAEAFNALLLELLEER